MNFETLKLGFTSYLEEISKYSNKEYITNNSDISIFMYANEFKEYLSEELNCDTSICSKSINEILDMEIINGQLKDIETELDNIEKLGNKEENINIEDNETINEKNQPIKNEEQGNITLPEGIPDENTEINDPEIITNILNGLLQDSTFKDILDKSGDGDGEVNEEELAKFLEVIKDYDNNSDNISLKDILAGVKDIQDGVFEFATDEEIQERIGETPQADKAYSSGGFNIPSTYGSAQNIFNGINEPQEKTLDNMSKEELSSELSETESDLSEKQTVLSDALTGNTPELKELKNIEDSAYKTYLEMLKSVDEEMATQLNDIKTSIDNKETEVNNKEAEISTQENVVNDCETAYNNAVNTTKSLNNSLSALKSTDTSKMDSEKISEINSKISELETKIAESEAKETETKKSLDEAQLQLENLNKEKDNLNKELDELKEQKTNLESEITQKYPEIQESMDAYNNAKQNYQDAQNTIVEEVQKGITESQDYIKEVKTAINNYDNKQNEKEYTVNGDAEELLDFAYKFLGFSEREVEAKCGYNLPDGLWCAAFVNYVLNETYGDEVPDWFKNCNHNSCSEILAAANNNGCAFKDVNDVKPGDLIIFNTSRGNARHIGIVVSVENGKVNTIEGNTSSHVGERSYEVGSSSINSFVRVN